MTAQTQRPEARRRFEGRARGTKAAVPLTPSSDGDQIDLVPPKSEPDREWAEPDEPRPPPEAPEFVDDDEDQRG